MKRLWISAFGIALAIPVCAAPIFRNPQPIARSITFPNYLRAGDFNGDGHPDVICVDSKIAVHLDDGTGPFAAPVETSVPYLTPFGLALGDVDRDGKLDVALSSVLTETIIVMKGSGNGAFTQDASISVAPNGPGAVTLADFNSDTFLDVAASVHDDVTFATDAVVVWLGDGAGNFSGSGMTTPVYAIGDLVPADLNGDGKKDLVSADPLRILIGNGDGTFTAQPVMTGHLAAVADFNHDGKPDIATDGVAIYLGNGDGTFATPALYPVKNTTSSITAVTLDGDANPDLLVADSTGSTVSVLRGNADGTFQPAQHFVAGPGAGMAAAGDFDRDGKLDVVTADNFFGLTALSFLPGNGDGTFRGYRAFHSAPEVRGGVVADMNHDSKPDVIVLQKQPARSTYDLAVLLNDGTGTLGAPIVTDTTRSMGILPPQFALGDVNGDGNLDAVVNDYDPNAPGAAVLLGDSRGAFAAPLVFRLETYGRPALGQFAGSPALDLFVAGQVYPGNGDGTFGSALFNPSPPAPVFGDVNGDGNLDYIQSGDAGTSVGLSDGNGHFTSAPVTSDSTNSPALGDFNGDGKLDLLLPTSSEAQTRFGNGNGTFGSPVIVAGNFSTTSTIQTADVNGDGHLDAVLGTTVFLGSGDGGFLSRSTFRTGPVSSPAAGDMDGNGSPDLVVTKSFAGDVDVLLTRTTADPTAQASISLSVDRTAATYPNPITATVTVTGGTTLLTGVVRFSAGNRSLALLPLDANGQAVFSLHLLVGTHTITTTYTGDEYYVEASASTTVTIVKTVPAVALQLTPATDIIAGQPVTVRLLFSNTPNPTGSVSFYRDGTFLQSVSVSQGAAEIQTAFDWGMHTMSADYSGDDYYVATTASQSLEAYAGNWGAPLQIRASGGLLTWSRVIGSTNYLVQRRTSMAVGWETYGVFAAASASYSIPPDTTWLFAVSAYDSGNNNLSPPSPPDLATSVPFIQAIAANATAIRAAHLLELRAAVRAVREFALLPPYDYANPLIAGDPIRAADVVQLRTALNDARGAIGLPAVSFTDPALTPGQTLMRAAHVLELRAGTD